MSATVTPNHRLVLLVATGTAAAALAIFPAGSAAALRPPDTANDPCAVVHWYVANNPSMNKPRAEQEQPDHRTWAVGCE